LNTLDFQILINQINTFLFSTPEENLLDRYYFLSNKIKRLVNRTLLIAENIRIAKNIAYSYTAWENTDFNWNEMHSFYDTFRHSDRLNRCLAGAWEYIISFYKKAEETLRSRGHYDAALEAYDAAARLGVNIINSFNDENLNAAFHIIPLEPQKGYLTPEPFKDGFIALRSDKRMVLINESGVFLLDKLNIGEPVESFIKTDDKIYLVGPYAKFIYTFDDTMNYLGRMALPPCSNKRVPGCRTVNGFILFPYDNSFCLYDNQWRLLCRRYLPQARLVSEPQYYKRAVYFRNANDNHKSSELLRILADGTVEFVTGGLDFAPKCCFSKNLLIWPNRTSFLFEKTVKNSKEFVHLPLSVFNKFGCNSYMKGTHIHFSENCLTLFGSFTKRSIPASEHFYLIKIKMDLSNSNSFF